MAQHQDPPPSSDGLDELVEQLLSCGAVLSQIISGMLQWEAAGLSAPDAAPIPTVAHSLIRGVLTDLTHRHSRRDLKSAARIVSEATEAVCDAILFVPLDEAGSSGIDGHAGDSSE